MPEVKINGRSYDLPDDEKKFTYGELATVQQITKHPIGELMELFKTGDVTAQMALVWLAMHRADPRVTIEDIEALQLGEVEFLEGDASPPEPSSIPELSGIPS